MRPREQSLPAGACPAAAKGPGREMSARCQPFAAETGDKPQ